GDGILLQSMKICGIKLEYFSLNKGLREEYSLTQEITMIITAGVWRISEKKCQKKCYKDSIRSSLARRQQQPKTAHIGKLFNVMIARRQRRNVNVMRRVYYAYLLQKDIFLYHHYHHYHLHHGLQEHNHYHLISKEDDYLTHQGKLLKHLRMTMLSTYYYRSQVYTHDHRIDGEDEQ